MKRVSARGSRNMLVQRVIRHAGLPTLFRASDTVTSKEFPAAVSRILGAHQTGTEGRVVQASLLPPYTSLPKGFLVGQHLQAGFGHLEIDSPDSGAVPSSIYPLPADTLQGSINLKPGDPVEEADRDQTRWRRLQSIFHRHQETGVQEPARSEDVPITAILENHGTKEAIQSKVGGSAKDTGSLEASSADLSGAESDARIQTTSVPETITKQAIESRQSQSDPADVTEKAPSVGVEAGEALAHQPGQLKRPVSRDSHLSFTPDSHQPPWSEQRTRFESRPPGLPKDAQVIEPGPTGQAADISEDKPGVSNAGDVVAGETAVNSETSPDREEGTTLDSSLQAQKVPLQAAWPVQRLVAAAETADSDQPEPGSIQSREILELRVVQRSAAFAEQTKTPIEIIPPRRPHPLANHMESRQRSEPSSHETELPEDTSFGQDHPTSKTSDKNLDAVPAQITAEKQQFIETAVGPLPADLWGLIGQPAPGQGAEAPGASVPEKTVEFSGTDSRALDATFSSPPIIPDGGQENAQRHWPTVVQRRTDQDQAESQPGLGSEAYLSSNKTDEQVSEDSVQDQKIDDLARQVYTEIRRRLTIERERLPGRF